MSKRNSATWVVVGGKVGELAHCTHCGRGLSIELPQSLSVIVAATGAFSKDHSHCKPGGYVEPKPTNPQEWAAGRDVGVSSFTIYSVMTGMPTRLWGFDTPKDSGDFGRCYRFLNLFPQYRARLSEVSKRFPKWLPLVNNWEELESLYAAALEGDSGEALYLRIKELNGDNLPIVGGKEAAK